MWHCALRAAPEDKTLSDDEWAAIACDVMNRTGLSRDGQEDHAVRRIAVRHAGDHIYLVAVPAGRHSPGHTVRHGSPSRLSRVTDHEHPTTRHSRRRPLPACPLGVSAVLTLAPEYSPWRLQRRTATPARVMDGGGQART